MFYLHSGDKVAAVSVEKIPDIEIKNPEPVVAKNPANAVKRPTLVVKDLATLVKKPVRLVMGAAPVAKDPAPVINLADGFSDGELIC